MCVYTARHWAPHCSGRASVSFDAVRCARSWCACCLLPAAALCPPASSTSAARSCLMVQVPCAPRYMRVKVRAALAAPLGVCTCVLLHERHSQRRSGSVHACCCPSGARSPSGAASGARVCTCVLLTKWLSQRRSGAVHACYCQAGAASAQLCDAGSECGGFVGTLVTVWELVCGRWRTGQTSWMRSTLASECQLRRRQATPPPQHPPAADPARPWLAQLCLWHACSLRCRCALCAIVVSAKHAAVQWEGDGTTWQPDMMA